MEKPRFLNRVWSQDPLPPLEKSFIQIVSAPEAIEATLKMTAFELRSKVCKEVFDLEEASLAWEQAKANHRVKTALGFGPAAKAFITYRDLMYGVRFQETAIEAYRAYSKELTPVIRKMVQGQVR